MYEDDGLGLDYFYYLSDRTAALVTSLRSGDLTVVPQLVEAYIPMARRKAVKYGGRKPEMREQFYSEALYQLFFAVHKASEQLTDDNLTYYLSAWLERHLKRFAWKSAHVVSWDSVNRKGRKNWNMVQHPLDDEHLARDMRPVEEFRVNLLALARNSTEHAILERLMDGETGAEIAESLGIGAASVSRIRQSLYERYLNVSKSESTSVTSECVHARSEAASTVDAYLTQW